MTGIMQAMVGATFSSGGGTEPLALTFYENRNGADIGTINVYVVDTSGNIQGSSVYTASGDNGDVWVLRTASTPNVSGSFRIAWHYVSGSSFRGDYAIDTVTLQGNSYDLNTEQGFLTTSEINTSSSTAALASTVALTNSGASILGRWNQLSGATSSSGTGPSGAQDGSFYYYTETSTVNIPNVNMWLFSPVITV